MPEAMLRPCHALIAQLARGLHERAAAVPVRRCDSPDAQIYDIQCSAPRITASRKISMRTPPEMLSLLLLQRVI